MAGKCGKPAVGRFMTTGDEEPRPRCVDHYNQLLRERSADNALNHEPAQPGDTCDEGEA